VSDEIARVASSMRRVIDRMVGTTAPPEEFGTIADELDALAARLAAYEQHTIFHLGGPTATDGAVTDYSPVTGRLHPFAPPVLVTSVGRRVEGTVTFGSAYEGPPGHVHGGFVAATLDELLGMTMAVQHLPGMTARLTVRYRRATPLHTELRVVAEVGRIDGRKVHVDGRIEHDDETCAEADGLFLLVDFDRFRRRDRGGPPAKEHPAGP
jgi:acyl-coenzyme A thioesterase PaaI-like protein